MHYAYEFARTDDILNSLKLVKQYLGGTPTEARANYDSASSILLAQRDSPPTLLIHGQRDELVWFRQSERLSARLDALGTPHCFLQLPWATHAFDYNFNGPGGQISTYAVEKFPRGRDGDRASQPERCSEAEKKRGARASCPPATASCRCLSRHSPNGVRESSPDLSARCRQARAGSPRSPFLICIVPAQRVYRKSVEPRMGTDETRISKKAAFLHPCPSVFIRGCFPLGATFGTPSHSFFSASRPRSLVPGSSFSRLGRARPLLSSARARSFCPMATYVRPNST